LSILPWTIAPNADPASGKNSIRQSQKAPITLLSVMLIGVPVSPFQQPWLLAAVYSVRWLSPSEGKASQEFEYAVNSHAGPIFGAWRDD